MKSLKISNSGLFATLRWLFISGCIGNCCGIASAVFLYALEKATQIRELQSWLLFFLPVGGFVVGAMYHYLGKRVEGGNNLIVDQFHDPQSIIPFRMAPLILLGTMVTHLFGGSAGREGTAVQMGGSIADQFTSIFKVNRDERRSLLMAGMAGGFGSVFGVPFAGTVFGLEVLTIGRLHLWGLVECAVAAFVAHFTTLALGIHHTNYVHADAMNLNIRDIAIVVLAGIVFGIAARIFFVCSHQISKLSKSKIPYLPLRSFAGGALISSLYFFFPTLTRYVGLGVPIIIESLKSNEPIYDWLGKLLMTALTLGTGFKGGEVTPLLFVGATLGNALSQLPHFHMPLLAYLGFVGVFAGAANTPLACTIMAMELFGPGIGFYAAIACFSSYAASGHRGIYHAQRVHIPKVDQLRRLREHLKILLEKPDLTPERIPEDQYKKHT